MKHIILLAVLAVLALSVHQRDHKGHDARHEDWNDYSKSIST